MRSNSNNVPVVDYNIIPSQLETEMLVLLISAVLTTTNIFKCQFVTTADVNFRICNTANVMCWPVKVIFEKSIPCFRGNANSSLQNVSVDAV
jgi:hypothetical protein